MKGARMGWHMHILSIIINPDIDKRRHLTLAAQDDKS